MATGRPNLLSALLTGDIWRDALVKAVNYLLTVEDVTVIQPAGASGTAFQNGWRNRGSAETNFYKKHDRVYIEGKVDSGTNSLSAFTLPEGYRPTRELQFLQHSAATGAGTVLIIRVNGEVVPTAGSGNGMFLDGVHFRTA